MECNVVVVVEDGDGRTGGECGLSLIPYSV
jgi:hypothetical protein